MMRETGWPVVVGVVLLVAVAALGAALGLRHRARTSPARPRSLFLYAEAARVPAAPPARFAARLPRVQEFRLRGADVFPPPAHVRDLLCAGDPGMWSRLGEALAASGPVPVREVMATYGAELKHCPGDGCFALALVARSDPAPLAAPAWMVLARCPGPEADAAFARPGAPAEAVLARADRARWGSEEPGDGLRAPPPERVAAAAQQVIREGDGLEPRLAAFALVGTGPSGVEALLALHAAERDTARRHDLAMALGDSPDARAQAAWRAACAEGARDPACRRSRRTGPAATPQASPTPPSAPPPPSPALVARLRELALLPAAGPAQGRRAEELLLASRRAHAFDTETGEFPNEHDALLRALAALAGGPLQGTVFEELPPPEDDEQAPYLLRAYAGGERFEVRARNLGDWYDVEAAVGLLNTLARARALDVRWLVLASGDQTATVVAGPEAGLRTAVAERLLEAGGADEAMAAGKGFEEQVLKQLQRQVR